MDTSGYETRDTLAVTLDADPLTPTSEKPRSKSPTSARFPTTLRPFSLSRLRNVSMKEMSRNSVPTSPQESDVEQQSSTESDELEEHPVTSPDTPGTQLRLEAKTSAQDLERSVSLSPSMAQKGPDGVDKGVADRHVPIRRRKRRAFEMLQEEASGILEGWEHYDKVMSHSSTGNLSSHAKAAGVKSTTAKKIEGPNSSISEQAKRLSKTWRQSDCTTPPLSHPEEDGHVEGTRQHIRLEVVLRAKPAIDLEHENTDPSPVIGCSPSHDSPSASGSVKRRRGRPRKHSVDGESQNKVAISPTPSPGRRQISAKDSQDSYWTTPLDEGRIATSAPLTTPRGRSRGRPRKRGFARSTGHVNTANSKEAASTFTPGQTSTADADRATVGARPRRRGRPTTRRFGKRTRAGPVQGRVQSAISHSLRG